MSLSFSLLLLGAVMNRGLLIKKKREGDRHGVLAVSLETRFLRTLPRTLDARALSLPGWTVLQTQPQAVQPEE